jgi:hypothetical protein
MFRYFMDLSFVSQQANVPNRRCSHCSGFSIGSRDWDWQARVRDGSNREQPAGDNDPSSSGQNKKTPARFSPEIQRRCFSPFREEAAHLPLRVRPKLVRSRAAERAGSPIARMRAETFAGGEVAPSQPCPDRCTSVNKNAPASRYQSDNYWRTMAHLHLFTFH